MNIYPDIKKIASANAKISECIRRLEDKIDCDGLSFAFAHYIDGCTEKCGHLYHKGHQLDNCGLVDDDYYCCQHTGYLEDDFYGTIYFKTNVPGQFVAVPFSM